MNWKILPSSLSGELICINMVISNSKKIQNKTIRKNISIITLTGTTGRRVLNKSFFVLISGYFEFYAQEYSIIFWFSIIEINAQSIFYLQSSI